MVPTWTQGDKLRKARVLAGLTHRDMADFLGVSHGLVCLFEQDKRPARAAYVRLWAIRTGVDLDWLSDGALASIGWLTRSVRLVA